MFFSNSVVIINISSSKIDDFQLNNISFEKNGKFFSLMFDPVTSIGEIHWSESFSNGKFNIINFFKKANEIYLFTSAIQNYKPFEIILHELFSPDINITIKFLNFPLNKYIQVDLPEILSFEIDEYFGVAAILNIKSKHIFLKIYSNGLVTYTQVNDLEIVIEILKVISKIFEVLNSHD